MKRVKCKITINYIYSSFSMTNGGKSTLSRSLHQQVPNSCIIAQDSYFKARSLNQSNDFTLALSYWTF